MKSIDVAQVLKNVCSYRKDKIRACNLNSNIYISTENMKSNRAGVEPASSVPHAGRVAAYEPGDILISNIRPYFKKIWKAKQRGGCSNDVLVFKAGENVDNDFLYYVLSDDAFFDFMMMSSKGTKMPRGDKDVIMTYPVPRFSIEKQRKIASILSALDDKIETNNAICRNLEEQVMAIHHYFIITKLCETKKLEQLVEFSKIKRHKSTLELENYFSTENMLPDKAGATAAASLPCVNFVTGCRKGDILISNIRPYFKKIVYCTTEGGCSSDVLCFHPRENTYSAWLYSSLYSDDFFNYVMQGSKGTKMPRGDKSHIMKYGIYVLSEKDLLQFNELAVPMLSLISHRGYENQKISKLRDCLLAKLMNGEIDLGKLGKLA